jgi:hypothetical protein
MRYWVIYFLSSVSESKVRINKKYILIQSLIVVLLILAAECYLRISGYAPGDLRPAWSNFKPVDSLVVYNDFIVDSSGILVANKERFRKLQLRESLNKQGFRTTEFDQDTASNKIMLIGDSFTWGLSANPIDSCFADLLPLLVYRPVVNTGIPIADPAQYEAIAARYITVIKPQMVVVMFYLGNDIMQKPRPIIPLQPFYYYTNAGALMADDGDVHLKSAQEAYQYYTREKFFILHPANIGEWLVSKSALLSRVYSLRYRWDEKKRAEHAIEDMTVTQRYLYHIVDICRKNKCRLKIVLIPELKEAGRNKSFFEKRYKGFFRDSVLAPVTYIPEHIPAAYYVPNPDGHLNNAGHNFYAHELARIVLRED